MIKAHKAEVHIHLLSRILGPKSYYVKCPTCGTILKDGESYDAAVLTAERHYTHYRTANEQNP